MEERQSTLKRRPNLRKIGVIAVIVLVAVASYFVIGRSSVGSAGNNLYNCTG